MLVPLYLNAPIYNIVVQLLHAPILYQTHKVLYAKQPTPDQKSCELSKCTIFISCVVIPINWQVVLFSILYQCCEGIFSSYESGY